MEDDEVICDVVSAVASVRLYTAIAIAKPSIVEFLYLAMFTSPGHKHKHYDGVTHTSSHPLFACQASGRGPNDDRPRPMTWLDSDCDWLKQLKRFTAGAFCFGCNKTVSKQFQNCFGTVLFQFQFYKHVGFYDWAC